MRSWSLRPPYVRFGVPSWTVAKHRFCWDVDCCGNLEQDGRAIRDRAFADAADGAVVLDSILKVFGCSIEQREWRDRMAMERDS